MDPQVDLDPVPDLLNTVRIPADPVVTLPSDRVDLDPVPDLLNTVRILADRVVTHLSGTRTQVLALVRSGQM